MKNKLITIGYNEQQYNCTYEIHYPIIESGNMQEIIGIKLWLPNDDDIQYFDFQLTTIDNNILKVTSMFAGNDYQRKKGIPEALILMSKSLFNKKIISSSRSNINAEFRNPAATKVWKRLVHKGLAKYNKEKDIYELN